MNIKKYVFPLLAISVLLGAVYMVYSNPIAEGILNQGDHYITGPANGTEILATNQVTLSAFQWATSNASNATWYFQSGGEASGTVTHIANVTNHTGSLNFTGIIPISALHGYGNLSINITSNQYAFLNHTQSNSNGSFILNESDSQINATGFNLIFIKNLEPNNLTIANPTNRSNVSGTVNFQIQYTGGYSYLVTNSSWYLDGNGTNTTISTSNTVGVVNASIDTTKLADGSYIVWFNATNASGVPGYIDDRLNYTVNFTIDNTQPTMSSSLDDSDSKIFTRQEITLTCSGTDKVSGVNGKLVTTLVKPNGAEVVTNIDSGGSVTWKDAQTAATGTYQAKCKATDYAGNVVIFTKEFTVRVRSSGSPSGGTDGPSADYSLEGRDTTVASGREGSSKTFTLDGTTTHTIEFLTVTDTSATLKISSTPQEFTLNIGASQDVDLNDDGKLDVTVTLDNIQNGRASISLDKLEGAADIAEPSTEEVDRQEAERQAEEERKAREQAAASTTTIVIIIVIIIVVVGGYFLWKKGSKGKGKKGHIKFSRAELRSK